MLSLLSGTYVERSRASRWAFRGIAVLPSVRVVDIRSEDGNEVHIELSDGRIVVLTVEEILGALASVEPYRMSLLAN